MSASSVSLAGWMLSTGTPAPSTAPTPALISTTRPDTGARTSCVARRASSSLTARVAACKLAIFLGDLGLLFIPAPHLVVLEIVEFAQDREQLPLGCVVRSLAPFEIDSRDEALGNEPAVRLDELAGDRERLAGALFHRFVAAALSRDVLPSYGVFGLSRGLGAPPTPGRSPPRVRPPCGAAPRPRSRRSPRSALPTPPGPLREATRS